MSQEQFDQIFKDGTFNVASNMSTTPYVWRVHPLIIKGWENIKDCWYSDMARAYHQMRQIGKRINGDTLSLMLNISELRLYPERMVNMFVGVKQMAVDKSPDYDRLLEIRFMEYKFKKYFEKDTHELYDELYMRVFIKQYDESEMERQRLQRRIDKLTETDIKF